MGIFSLFTNNNSDTKETADKNAGGLIISTECPYCNIKLNKIPGRKKKCDSCGEFIYVRTRPSDLKRILATKEQADKIDEEWSIVNGTHDYYIAQKGEYEEAREILKKRFGKDPSENDIKWSILNKKLISGGDYRSTRYEMAEILRKEQKFDQALDYYLEVCYMDLDEGQKIGVEDLSTYLAPAVVEGAKKMINKLNLSRNETRNVFTNRINKIKGALKISLSAERAWSNLEKVFFG